MGGLALEGLQDWQGAVRDFKEGVAVASASEDDSQQLSLFRGALRKAQAADKEERSRAKKVYAGMLNKMKAEESEIERQQAEAAAQAADAKEKATKLYNKEREQRFQETWSSYLRKNGEETNAEDAASKDQDEASAETVEPKKEVDLKSVDPKDVPPVHYS